MEEAVVVERKVNLPSLRKWSIEDVEQRKCDKTNEEEPGECAGCRNCSKKTSQREGLNIGRERQTEKIESAWQE